MSEIDKVDTVKEDENKSPLHQKKHKKKWTKKKESKEYEKCVQSLSELTLNKGKGAGGANTNYYGKKFENKTDFTERLLDMGYEKHYFPVSLKMKHNYYLQKTFEDRTVVYVTQNGLKTYMERTYNMDLFRCPDEAYIIEYHSGKKVIKILEKKNQNVPGSVETKLWSGPSLKREYEMVLGNEFEVHYAFCVSSFFKMKLQHKEEEKSEEKKTEQKEKKISYKMKQKQLSEMKYGIFRKILDENNIPVFFGEDEDYFTTMETWIHSSSP